MKPSVTHETSEKRHLPEPEDEKDSPSKKRQACNDSYNEDDDVQVVAPPKPHHQIVDLLSDSLSTGDLEVGWSNLTNPNVDYVHARKDCGVYKFEDCHEKFCDKCYCIVCDIPAKECKTWGQHCHSTSSLQTIIMASRKSDRRNRRHEEREDRGREKSISEMRITEVLAKKLARAVNLSDGKDPDESSDFQSSGEKAKDAIEGLKMEGDIGQLRLLNNFFVEGIKIGWPFPVILQPQRMMAIHIIRALKRKLHVVLESPTGTGKSAAILCSVLAWQRYQAQRHRVIKNQSDPSISPDDKKEDLGQHEGVPVIIYCSRTHSQVAQMVASLKKTPYRPRMTVLGSRQRLCINSDLVEKKGLNINMACRERKQETDRQRKLIFNSGRSGYDDNNPFIPERMVEEESGEQHKNGSRQTNPICSHYMNLTSERTVMGIQSRFVWDTKRITSCSAGGEHSSLGVHDIEDLVSFGKNPYLEKNIAIYREAGQQAFGINLANRKDGGCEVVFLRKDSISSSDGRLLKGDWIVKVNGQNTKHWNMDQICDLIRALPKDPLVIDVLRDKGIAEAMDLIDSSIKEPSSKDAHCPYYVSRALKSHANLIFAPYNYVLDPGIRKSLQINIAGAVVILDEAHNVEDTLKESGSGDFGEMDLCQLLGKLSEFSNVRNFTSRDEQMIEISTSGEMIMYPKVAHEILLFVESLILFMRELRLKFETSPGLERVKNEHSRFHLADDHEVEVKYSGPTGYGLKGEAVGCAPLMTELGITPEICSRLLTLSEALESHLFRELNESDAVLRDLTKVIECLSLAARNPEHFYMAMVMKPNGNIEYATGMNEDEYAEIMRTKPWKRNPRKIPYAHPRSDQHPNDPIPTCHHEFCKTRNDNGNITGQAVRHGDFCNGKRPRWECHLILRLLSPGLQLKELGDQCRSVIFASGSLAPLPSLCAELNLYGPKPKQALSESSPRPDQKVQTLSLGFSQGSHSRALPSFGRLQTTPKPLEANHVVNLPKQLFAVSVGHFPDGTPLTVTYSHYKESSFFPKLGHAIATIVESIPRGGVLLFFPSYYFLNKCVKCWNPAMEQVRFNQHISPQIWGRLLAAKGKIIIEPTGSQEKFELARKEYSDKIKQDGNCILLAVFRGKMSEGISFNDENARCVICIGLPYPCFTDRAVKAKRSYNDEQRKIRKNTNLLPGDEWYSQQAHRAIAQALGRCIRHGADYGAIVMLDSRHCDDGRPNDGLSEAHKKFPKWMRRSIRTLSMRTSGGVGHNPVLGGYVGLKQNFARFFQEAPAESERVRNKWKNDLIAAQARSRQSRGPSFNRETGTWT